VRRRVVITGLGLICGVGNTTQEVWGQLLSGTSGVGPIAAFDTTGFAVTFAAEVKNFDPLQFIDKKESRKMARFIHLAIAATQEAMEQSGLIITPENEERVGVFIGSGIGGFEVIEREYSNLIEGGPRKISPFFIPSTIINMAAGQVSIRYGAKGPISATATACATSANSIGDSFRMIQHGEGDGFVLGEGAGMLVLEELEFAKARGAKILGEIIGYGMSSDAYHMTGIAPEGAGAQRSMRAALRDSGIALTDVDYVNAHATSTPAGDGNESRAIELVFGEHATSKTLKVSSTKSMTGHLLGAAGGLEAGITAMALINQKIPPTTNLGTPGEDCVLDYVANKAIDAKVNVALSNSFGFGGINATLIMRRWTE
jgi:3-oxoacyl-[acyl-carrier-protein] synthase II